MPTKSGSKTITTDPNWLGPAIQPGAIPLEEILSSFVRIVGGLLDMKWWMRPMQNWIVPATWGLMSF